MDLAFVVLHRDCPKMPQTMTAPPKFGLAGTNDSGDEICLRCSLCDKLIRVTFTEIEREDMEEIAVADWCG